MSDIVDDGDFSDIYDEAEDDKSPIQTHNEPVKPPASHAPENIESSNATENVSVEVSTVDNQSDIKAQPPSLQHQAQTSGQTGLTPVPTYAPIAVVSEDSASGPSGNSGIKEDGKMFIGGLNWETTDTSLRDYFTQYGEVLECTVMRDGATGRSRGFGFLTFKDPKTVNVVMVKEHYLDGKIIDPKRAIPREEQDKTSKIFVGGVSQEATEQDFKNFFAQFGRVVDATLMIDKDTGRPRGFGFVTFDSDDAIDACLSSPLAILGKPIEVKRAEPRNLRDEKGKFPPGAPGAPGGKPGFQRPNEGGFDPSGQAGPNAQGPMGMQNPGGMTPATMAQYWLQMQKYMQMMQGMQGQGMSGGGQVHPGMASNMHPMMQQQMLAMQHQRAAQGGGPYQGMMGQNMGQNMGPPNGPSGHHGGMGGGSNHGNNDGGDFTDSALSHNQSDSLRGGRDNSLAPANGGVGAKGDEDSHSQQSTNTPIPVITTPTVGNRPNYGPGNAGNNRPMDNQQSFQQRQFNQGHQGGGRYQNFRRGGPNGGNFGQQHQSWDNSSFDPNDQQQHRGGAGGPSGRGGFQHGGMNRNGHTQGNNGMGNQGGQMFQQGYPPNGGANGPNQGPGQQPPTGPKNQQQQQSSQQQPAPPAGAPTGPKNARAGGAVYRGGGRGGHRGYHHPYARGGQ